MSTQIFTALRLPLDIFVAISDLFRRPRLLLFAAIPWLLGLAVFIALLSAGYAFRESVSTWITGDANGWISWFIEAGFLFVSGVFAGVGAFVVALVLGGFFLELLVEEVLRGEGLEVPVQTLPALVWKALVDGAMRVVFFAMLGLFLWIFSFIPLLNLLALAVSCFFAGYQVFEIPLEVLGLRFKKRLKISLANYIELLVFGGIIGTAMLFPLGALLLLPPLLVVATKRAIRWLGVI